MSYNEQMAVPNSDFNNNDYQLNSVTGIIFKVRNNMYSFRGGVDYLKQKDNNSAPDCPTCPGYTGANEQLKVGVGFEREFFYYNVRPVIGLDVFYFRSEYNGKIVPPSGVLSSVENIRNGAGFTPFIGVKIYPMDRITISATANFNGIWFHEKIQNTLGATMIKTSVPATTRYETYFNPLGGLTLLYNFGSLED
ncbi:hypothetical protein D3C78_1365330 [compost metagenome]